MKIFEARYCPCIYESGMVTLSLHRTKKGAKESIRKHKAKKKKEFDELYDGDEKPFKFGQFEHWDIIITEVLE